MSREWRALQRGESATTRRREIERAYERFIADGPESSVLTEQVRQGAVREIVLNSWRRARTRSVDPDREPRAHTMSDDELRELRRIHPLAAVLPVLERLLVSEAHDSGFIVAVGDAEGRLLWVDGDHRLRSQAEDIGFTVGTDWSEHAVGTSAPGSALVLKHSIQVFGAEHWGRAVHEWSCAATPVHDPETGAIIGVIDITGGDTIAQPHVLPLVEATRAAVEAELTVEAMRRRVEQDRDLKSRRTSRVLSAAAPADAPPRLHVLGREHAVLDTGHGTLEIGGRHAEILVALVTAPRGLSAQQLAEAVYGTAKSEETLRAELVRLRKFLERFHVSLTVASRPYRLAGTLRLDAADALAALSRGAHRLALSSYGGPVLPGSEAPAVLVLRDDLHATLREAMLQSAAPDLLFEYAQNWAEDDEHVWETLLHVLPPLSPKRARVAARLEHLRAAAAHTDAGCGGAAHTHAT